MGTALRFLTSSGYCRQVADPRIARRERDEIELDIRAQNPDHFLRKCWPTSWSDPGCDQQEPAVASDLVRESVVTSVFYAGKATNRIADVTDSAVVEFKTGQGDPGTVPACHMERWWADCTKRMETETGV